MTAKLYTLMGVCFLVFACKKTATPPEPTGPVTTTEINTWICDSMIRYSFYTNELNLSADKNLDNLSYFKTLQSKNDRFSFIQLNNGISSAKKTCRSLYGFDYVLFTEASSGKTVGLITLVMDYSPAKGAGLERGMYFTKINNEVITESNSTSLAEQILTRTTNQLEVCSLLNGSFVKIKDASIKQGIIWDETFIVEYFTKNNLKIGYLFFTAFLNNHRTFYQTIFEEFKAKRINDLIIDLRYNTGGDVAAAATLCSMITKNIAGNSVFVKYKGNKFLGDRVDTFEKAVSISNGPSFVSLQAYNVNLPRIFVLTTGATASSAELIINNLKPYVNVIQIGSKTFGKDEAFFQLADKRSKKRIDEIIYPVVYKLYNSLGEGNYSSGISPKYVFNEIDELPLTNFGTNTDPLISNCLSRIVGILPASGGKNTNPVTVQNVANKVLYNSSLTELNVKLPILN
jgi:C-terminal processing protease CtpA/Prc